MHKQPKVVSTKRSTLNKSHAKPKTANNKKRITPNKQQQSASTRLITISTTPLSTQSKSQLTQSNTAISARPHSFSTTTSHPLTTAITMAPTRLSRRQFSTETSTTPLAPQPNMASDFYKLDLRVSLLDNIRDHPNADSLYLIDCHVGEDVPRQLVSNVKPYMSIQKLTKRQQVVLCNLKPVGFRGEKSFAMMLGGSPSNVETPPSPTPDAQNGLAEPAYIPSNTQVLVGTDTGSIEFKPGQRLYLAGQAPVQGEIARINDKAIAKLFAELGTDSEGNLMYLNQPVVFGPIDAPVRVGLGVPNAQLF